MSFFSNLISKVKGKKKSDDFDDDDFDLDEDDFEDEEGGVPAPSAMRDDDDDDDFDPNDFDDDDDFGEGPSKKKGGSKKKLILMASAATLTLAAIGGGSYWYFFMADEEMTQKTANGTSVALTLGQPEAGGGLTPQQKVTKLTGAPKLGGGAPTKLGAPVGVSKLSTGGAKLSSAVPGKLNTPTNAVMATSVNAGMGGYDPDNKVQPLSSATVAEVGINIPSILPRAVADLGPAQTASPLAALSDEGLFEKSDNGKLPIISAQGKEPWKTYARPYKSAPQDAIVGLVVTGLGMSKTLTQAAIEHLPADVTLSFTPYGSGVKNWVDQARAMGHEVLLELPMETESFPVDDPGPMAMMTSKTPSENLRLLSLLMAQAQGYIGFVGQHGSTFTKNKKAFAPILGEIKSRGLFFMGSRASEQSLTLEIADQIQLPRAISDSSIQVNTSPSQVRAQLETLATIAISKKATAALIPASPLAIKMIKEWAGKLQNVRIAPMSSLAGRQES